MLRPLSQVLAKKNIDGTEKKLGIKQKEESHISLKYVVLTYILITNKCTSLLHI